MKDIHVAFSIIRLLFYVADIHSVLNTYIANTSNTKTVENCYYCRSITVLSERLGQTLECLHVDGSELSDSAIEAISQSSRLKHLCISNGGNLTDTALTHIQV